MNNKDNRSTGAMIVTIAFAMVVFTALFVQHQSADNPVAVVEQSLNNEPMTFSEPEFAEEIFASENELVKEEIPVPDPPVVISFTKAFAVAREALGPGQSFTWNGKQYSTNTTEEEAQMAKVQPEIKLADAQDSLVNTLTDALTPEL